MECNQRRWTKGVNTFERVQNSELSEKITKIKLRKSQKIKLHVTSFEFISFWVIVVSFFLFICHKSHTTLLDTKRLLKQERPFPYSTKTECFWKKTRNDVTLFCCRFSKFHFEPRIETICIRKYRRSWV